MNFLKAVQGPVVYRIGDQDVTFNPLTLRQCGEIVSAKHQRDRKALQETLQSANAPAAEQVKQLRDLDWEAGRFSYAVAYAQTIPGVVETLEKSSGQPVGDKITLDPQVLGLSSYLWGVLETHAPKQEQPDQSATG